MQHTDKPVASPGQSCRGASSPRFELFDHDADVGIVGYGSTVESAFVAAATAMFSIMQSEPSRAIGTRVTVELDESDLDLALVRWLNGLLAESHLQNLVLSQFTLSRQGDHWAGAAIGTPWPTGVEPGTEVKGATLTMLSVRSTPSGWEARCVVDV